MVEHVLRLILISSEFSRSSQVDAFFKRHYGPQSLTVTIVGDVDPAQVSAG